MAKVSGILFIVFADFTKYAIIICILLQICWYILISIIGKDIDNYAWKVQ